MSRTTVSLTDKLAAAIGRSGHGSTGRDMEDLLEREGDGDARRR